MGLITLSEVYVSRCFKSYQWGLGPFSLPAASQVFDMMKLQEQHACPGAVHLRYQDQPVCNRGFMRLLGIGKSRFRTMRDAVRRGAKHCPYDGRFIPHGPKPQSLARETVYDYLMELYHEAAEAIPDGLNSNKRPRQGAQRLDAKSLPRSGIRHLPPGSFSEYHQLCQVAHPGVTISRKLFASVARQQQKLGVILAERRLKEQFNTFKDNRPRTACRPPRCNQNH